MHLRQAFLCVAACTVAACTVADKHAPGGMTVHGDGGVTVHADAAKPAVDAAVPDTQPPHLVDVQPPPGAMWRHSPIHLTFDEPLAAASVLATTVTASFTETDAHNDVTATIGFEAPASVVLALDHIPKEAGTLNVTVSATIADLAGNTIAQPIELVAQLP